MLWLTLSLAQARCPDLEMSGASASAALDHAQTLYWWARASGDDLDLHCRSRAWLELAAEGSGAQAEAAREGLKASDARIDNSFDSVRNQYPPVWWLLGEDPVAEPDDGPGEMPDHAVRALENAWSPIAETLSRSAQERAELLVRCEGDEPMCPGLRDAAAALADAHPRVQSLPDEATTTGAAQLTLKVAVADRISEPRDAIRVDLALDDGETLQTSIGVGADHVPWRQLDGLWFALMVLFGMGAGFAGHALRGEEVRPRPDLLKILVGQAVGLPFGWFALDWAPAAPALDGVALTPSGGPAMAPLLWAAGLGGLLLIVPIAACALGLLVIGRRLGVQALDRFDLGLLAPAAVAVALGVGLAPIPVGMGWEGLGIGLSIGLPALAVAAVAGGCLEGIVQGGLGRGSRSVGVPLALAAGVLLVLLPIGLSGRFPLLLGLVGLGMAGLVARLGRVRGAAIQQASPSLNEGGGSLRAPRFVELEGRDPERHVNALKAPGRHLLVIEGTDGVGKTRLAHEIVRGLGEGWAIGIGEADAPAGQGQVRPYAVVSRALGQVLGEELELATVQARQAALAEVAGAAGEAALEMLPGVGALLSLGNDPDSAALTLERIRRDVVAALTARLQSGPALLLIDDLQWADPSSVGLLEHIRDAFEEPDEPLKHPLVLLVVQRPGTPDLAEEKVQLEPFTEAGVGALLGAAGVAAEAAFAARVADRVGGRPRHVLELVQELLTAELVEVHDDLIVVPEELDRAALAAAVPRHLRDLEEQRLERVRDRSARLLLQAGAQCGRTFTIGALAQGLDRSRMDVLGLLAQIEDEHGFVEDLDDDEAYRFRTELARQVLADAGAHPDGRPRKALREFHHRIVAVATDPGRVVFHGLQARGQALGAVASNAVRAAADAERRCALPEARELIGIARAHQAHLSSADADRLDLVEGKVLRASGERESQARAVELFRGLIESAWVDRYEVTSAWFATTFAIRRKSELAGLVDEIHRVRAMLDDAGGHSLVEAVCEFYGALARAEARGVRPGPDPGMATELGGQIDALRALEPSRARDLLLARLLQAQASRLEGHDAYLAVSRESLALKERHGDLAGQALTKGMLGNYFLWWADDPDPTEARRWLTEDLELVDRMGSVGALSSLHNRIALSYWMEGRKAEALDEASLALRRARQNASEVDLVFAAFSVLRYAAGLGDSERANEVGWKLVAPPEHWPWESADDLFEEVPRGILAARAEELAELAEDLEEVGAGEGWMERLEQLLA